MNRKQKRDEFDTLWIEFYSEALSWFDECLCPASDGYKPIKRDRRRLKKLLKLLKKGY